MAKQSIEDWIHETLNDADKGVCKRIGLVHVRNGGTEEEDILLKTLPDKIEADTVAQWAETFEDRAENYAAGLPGAQTFCMVAFHGNASKPTARKPFVEKGYTEQDGLMTEAPTGKGVLQQFMRHIEAIHRQSAAKDEAVFQVLAKALDSGSKEREALRRENVDGFNLIKELVLGAAGKQHEQRLAEISASQTGQMKAELLRWVPRLLNTVTGREIVPQNTDDTVLIEDMIDAMAQSGSIQNALPALQGMNFPPHLIAKFASRFQQGVEAREKERLSRQSVDDAANPNGLQ